MVTVGEKLQESNVCSVGEQISHPGRSFKASKSLTFELTAFNGLAFNVYSTIHIVVERTSWVTDLFPNTAYIAFLQLLTNRSHTSPK